jgi:hypothetical protein
MIARRLFAGFVILATAAAAQAPETATKWDYFVVSTPDFAGPFRGNDPAFHAPVPVKVGEPNVDVTDRTEIGELEAVVDADGKTTAENFLHVSGIAAEKELREIINQWRFKPATLDAKPIRVRLRITVSNDAS